MQSPQKGFTLLEIMIGVLLISSATLIFLKAINLFTTESVFYSEHFLTNNLNEKILETCFHETEMNPFGLQTLGLLDNSGKPAKFSSMVTDGQTAFFKNPSITELDTPVLHSKLKNDFKLTIACTNKIGDFVEVESNFSWAAKTGNGTNSSVCRFLTFDGDKEVETTYSMESSVVEARLLKNAFYASYPSINNAVPSFGAQELVMSIGHIYYPCFDLLSSDEYFQHCQKLEAMESPSIAPGTALFSKCSAAYYDQAKDYLHLLMYLKPYMEKIKEKQMFMPTIGAAYLPNIQGNLIRGMDFVKQIEYSLVVCIAKLASRYERQFDSEIYVRDKVKLLQRIFNFYRILYGCRNHSSTTFDPSVSKANIENNIKTFLTKTADAFKNSSPAISRLASQDLKYFQDGKLAANYFVPKTVEQLLNDVDELSNLKF